MDLSGKVQIKQTRIEPVIWQHDAVFIFGINLIAVSILTLVPPAEIASQ